MVELFLYLEIFSVKRHHNNITWKSRFRNYVRVIGHAHTQACQPFPNHVALYHCRCRRRVFCSELYIISTFSMNLRISWQKYLKRLIPRTLRPDSRSGKSLGATLSYYQTTWKVWKLLRTLQISKVYSLVNRKLQNFLSVRIYFCESELADWRISWSLQFILYFEASGLCPPESLCFMLFWRQINDRPLSKFNRRHPLKH